MFLCCYIKMILFHLCLLPLIIMDGINSRWTSIACFPLSVPEVMASWEQCHQPENANLCSLVLAVLNRDHELITKLLWASTSWSPDERLCFKIPTHLCESVFGVWRQRQTNLFWKLEWRKVWEWARADGPWDSSHQQDVSPTEWGLCKSPTNSVLQMHPEYSIGCGPYSTFQESRIFYVFPD